jgi:[ribosomal protein S18]-alanine N-acetyltransferase
MTTSIDLRVLRHGDLDTVAAIEAAVSPDPWSRDLFEGELAVHAARRHWLVADEGGRVVGFAGMMYVPDGQGTSDEGHLMNVAVDPARARRGVARRLLAALFADAAARGVAHLTLEVRVTNDAARALYRRFGFAPVGVRPRYYPGGEDALILWAHDIGDPGFQERLTAMAADGSAVAERGR